MTFKGKYHSEKLKKKGVIIKLVKDELYNTEVKGFALHKENLEFILMKQLT